MYVHTCVYIVYIYVCIYGHPQPAPPTPPRIHISLLLWPGHQYRQEKQECPVLKHWRGMWFNFCAPTLSTNQKQLHSTLKSAISSIPKFPSLATLSCQLSKFLQAYCKHWKIAKLGSWKIGKSGKLKIVLAKIGRIMKLPGQSMILMSTKCYKTVDR